MSGANPDPRGARRRSAWWPESGAASSTPALDGLRALAVLLVVMVHAFSKAPSGIPDELKYRYPIHYGRTGVQLFFVLSGFLLFLPYARWILGLRARPSTWLFYKRRALRVAPAYWVSLVLLIMVIGPTTVGAAGDGLLHAVFLHNITTSTSTSLNVVFWSMAVEVQFYVVLPVIAGATMWLTRRGGPSMATSAVVLTLVVGSAVGAWLHRFRVTSLPGLSLLSGQFSLPYWLGVFAAGIACSVAYVGLTEVTSHVRRGGRWLTSSGTATLILGVGSAIALAVVPPLQGVTFSHVWFGWAYAGLLFGVLVGWRPLRRPFETPVMRFIGLISYSLYIWHAVFLTPLEPHLAHLGSLPARVVVGLVIDLALSIPTAYLSFQLTERAFLAARTRAREPAGPARQAATSPSGYASPWTSAQPSLSGIEDVRRGVCRPGAPS